MTAVPSGSAESLETRVFAATARDDEVGALENEGDVVGVIVDDMIELEAEEGDLVVEAANVVGIGQPLFVDTGHFGGVEGVPGSGGKGSYRQSFLDLCLSCASAVGPGRQQV